MAAENIIGSWFRYFPEHYLWSQSMSGQICITHGQDDDIVPVEMAHRLYDACGSKEKELKIFTVEDGGSQHCVFDNLAMCGGWIADWWMDRFEAA